MWRLPIQNWSLLNDSFMHWRILSNLLSTHLMLVWSKTRCLLYFWLNLLYLLKLLLVSSVDWKVFHNLSFAFFLNVWLQNLLSFLVLMSTHILFTLNHYCIRLFGTILRTFCALIIAFHYSWLLVHFNFYGCLLNYSFSGCLLLRVGFSVSDSRLGWSGNYISEELWEVQRTLDKPWLLIATTFLNQM
jgi:hypothetical protein